MKATIFLNTNTSFLKENQEVAQETSPKEEETTDQQEDTTTDHQEDTMTDLQEEKEVKVKPEEKDQSEEKDKEDKLEEKIEKEELKKEEIDNTINVLKEEITTDHMTEISTEEEIMVIDLKEESNKDMNQEEKNTEKELQFNGLKLMKSVQEMTDSTLSSK